MTWEMKTYPFRLRYLLLVLPILGLFSSCSPARHLPEGQYLLTRNRVVIEGDGPAAEDISPILKQVPNKRIFGVFRFHLRAYNFLSSGKPRNYKTRFREIVGEAPVVLDTNLTDRSARQIRQYLQNKGYFQADVGYEIKYVKKNAVVTYNLLPDERYMINKMSYRIPDTLMAKIVKEYARDALISSGIPFDADILDDERDRLTRIFRNQGYYYFLPDFIWYHADTTIGGNAVDIQQNIDDPSNLAVGIPWNRTCRIQAIYIHTNHSNSPGQPPADTSEYVNESQGDTTRLFFVYREKDFFRSTLSRAIFIQEGDLYSIDEAQMTYSRLSDLRNFKYINIRYRLLDSTSSSGALPLVCDIYLTPLISQDYSIEGEGTNSAGNPGVAANLVYRNRNLMKGAEIFSLRLHGALEVQKTSELQSSTQVINGLPFNTVESGLDLKLVVPKFMVPFKASRFSKYFKPVTTLNAGFNYQQRPDYTRYISNASYGFQWRKSKKVSHTLNPFELSSIKIFPDSLFQVRINALLDPKLRIQYRDHLILSANYSYIYSSQQINSRVNFTYFRFNLESAGNLLRLGNTLLGSELSTGNSYSLFNIRYAQYVRVAADLRQYRYLTPGTSFAYRGVLGIGIPYGNLNVLPFEKSFYAGGSNGLRAWPLRYIGPGSYRDSSATVIERSGDIGFEAGFEYRFNIYKYFEGAAFIDAGNIWLTRPSDDFPGGDFSFDRFYREIALGAGLGLRLDFSFFILRLDAAIPVYDPAYSMGDRWQFDNLRLKRVNWNFAIGYPF